MKTKVTETIYSGFDRVIPMSSIQHVEKRKNDKDELVEICIVTDKTKWSFQYDTWENAIYIQGEEDCVKFLKAYCDFVAERDGMMEL